MRILLSIKAILNYLYNHLIDLVWTKKIRFQDGTEMTTVPTGNNLLDIKILSQAIADKGFAYMCHTNRRDLAKANVPTLYDFILDKLNNSEKQLQPLTQTSLTGRNIVYSKTLNKWFYTDSDNDRICATQNLINYTIVEDTCVPTNLVCGNNILIAYLDSGLGNHQKRYLIMNLQTNEIKYLNLSDNGVPFKSGAIRSIVKDGYIYILSTNRSNFKRVYKFLDDYSITNYSTISFTKNIYDMQYDNGYWFALLSDGVYKGTDINTPSNFTRIYSDSIYDSSFLIVKDNFSCYLSSRNVPIVFTYDLYQNVQQTGDNFDISYASAIPTYPKILNNTIWCNNDGMKIMSIDINTMYETVYSNDDVTGMDISENTIVYGSLVYMYYTGFVNKQYTDSYIINGSTVNINYYKNDDFKICIKDGGANDTNLETVFNYLGYLNYWLLDINNETVAIQRNNQPYVCMFVGDDFIDDSLNLPTQSVRCLPQAQEIIDSSASITLSEIKANTNYLFTNANITDITLSGCQTSFEETSIEFSTGNSAPTLTDNSGITWVDGSAPTLNANKSYLIVIFNKLGLVKEY